MMLRNPDHVTIAVADAAPAIEFFALLGFRKEHVTTIDGGEPAAYMGMPGMKAQHITLALDGAAPRFEIQLLEFEPTPGADPGEHPTNLRRRGYNHLAFRVDDIEAVTTRCRGDPDPMKDLVAVSHGGVQIPVELGDHVEGDLFGAGGGAFADVGAAAEALGVVSGGSC